ncbi:MAG: PorT family protein [Bacteroidales bacterium]|nr:PorT family protein [Bacteroidales bacterium]
MKKLLISVLVALTMFGANAGAQVRFGILGGFTSSSSKVSDIDASSISLYHAGFTVKAVFGGFGIQPSLLYQMKGTSMENYEKLPLAEAVGLTKVETKVGYLELPVQLQYGLDLLVMRPYLFAEPFVGYAVNLNNDAKGMKAVAEQAKAIKNDFKESNFNRFEYGLGVGAGVDLGSLQLSLKYFWNFGSLAEQDEVPNGSDITKAITKAIKDKQSFNGISISLAYFF